MRVPNRVNYKQWFRYEMIFVLGLIIGALILLLFYGKELDRLHLQIRSLENENGAYSEELKKLKENELKAKQVKKMVIDDIEIHIIDPNPLPNALTQEEFVRTMKLETKYLEGKSLESVNDMHDSVSKQFKDRRFKIGDRYVRVELRTMMIYKTAHLYFYVKLEPISP